MLQEQGQLDVSLEHRSDWLGRIERAPIWGAFGPPL
jgi:hypothetical protein